MSIRGAVLGEVFGLGFVVLVLIKIVLVAVLVHFVFIVFLIVVVVHVFHYAAPGRVMVRVA